ncbi:inverse autotransporter beta domain-containing protein [Edwardsiella anguillarum]|nr:inverse autotransporter beta domain-containing protein [Edwardsiella anguillarum]
MVGYNTFIDQDISGNNSRLGVGIEYWRDYLKTSLNTYFRLSGWHQSYDQSDYYERPANGFDLRVNAYLPSYPALGTKLIFEQYYGNNVALFDRDSKQSNPSAFTMGVNYTPIPLVTFGADYRLGAGGGMIRCIPYNLTIVLVTLGSNKYRHRTSRICVVCRAVVMI